MARFFKTLTLFCLPLLVILLPVLVVCFQSGEFYTIQRVQDLFSKGVTVVYGPAYSNYLQELQKSELLRRSPEVAVVGTSRVEFFRSSFLEDPSVFYNTTHGVVALSDYAHLISLVPTSTAPTIIIAGMEPYFFNPDNVAGNTVERPNPYLTESNLYEVFLESVFRNKGVWRVYADYFEGKYTLRDLFSSPAYAAIGLRALSGYQSGGTIHDGSDYFKNLDTVEHHRSVAEGIRALANTITETSGDEYGSGISPAAIVQLRNFLALCKQKGIHVIGFLPPESHEGYVRHQQFTDAPYYTAFRTLPTTLSSIYREYGFNFYDFRDNTKLGGSDMEMVEAKHGGEKMYLRLFIHMAEHDKKLKTYVDVPYLKNRLESATSTYYVFSLTGE